MRCLFALGLEPLRQQCLHPAPRRLRLAQQGQVPGLVKQPTLPVKDLAEERQAPAQPVHDQLPLTVRAKREQPA
jgi:hypothetical protein